MTLRIEAYDISAIGEVVVSDTFRLTVEGKTAHAAEVLKAVDESAAVCPVLNDEVTRAQTVKEVQELFRLHSCEMCKPGWRKAV